ncbi:cellulose synthase/poly-beta-1,6-N-acetylglucosamine synthase-like glycosyltransferase [Natrinema hispanicum]|uniref:Cellulose synthase/poly-beta-1,6-N-acetylglucosamine synthase-like glycosyltransferase n=1 Tax=Natrinema hispanicum TaxID=392421 RepID=A0A482Y9I5_9EURY|nr:glycosyltransferase [Natrinema hispanicum]RZV11166.1 cellulose synthase/poly-beta-1,6-N-acetylglucosamine synthase-like glycosyltransferase [Natrinema hispanicum]
MNLLVVAAVSLLAVTAAPYVCYLLLYAWIRPQGSPADKEPAEPTVSIVLPTYNEEQIVETKLDDLLALDYPMEKVELVVVDSSSDDTREIIREYFADLDAPDLVLLEENERRGLAPALNDAYAAASNDMVVKTDCDSKLSPNVLREAAANLADDDIAAVTGQNVEVLGGSEVESGYRGVQSHIQQLESHLDSTLIFHGPFSAFENDALLPIDPNSLADDTELALKIRRQGGRVIFDPAVEYMEASHSEFVKRRKQKDRRGMGLIRLLVQHRDALGRYGKYGKVVLPFNWWFMIVSPWLLAVTLIVGTGAAVSLFDASGLVVPGVVGVFAYLGQKDLLGPVQALYSIFDTQVSLLRASVELLVGDSDGTWDVDAELREAFE